jgi:ketopantoate reductase
LFGAAIALVGPAARDCVTQDHLRRRASEVDLINGRVVDTGARFEVATPFNAALIELTGRIRRGELTPDPANLPLLEALDVAA